MAKVVLPPALPLPSEDAQERRRQATRLRERQRQRALSDEEDEEEPPMRYALGTMIGTVAAAEAGEGSSNELHGAAYHGLIDALIKVQKGPEALRKANARDSLGRTPLVVAVGQGHVHCVEALVSLGADVDATDSAGFTPLMLASQAGQLAMCATLLRRGANLHATAIHDAIEDAPRKGKALDRLRGSKGRSGRITAVELAGNAEVDRLLRDCNEALLRDPDGGIVRVCGSVLSRVVAPPPPPPGLPPIGDTPGRQKRPAGGIDHLSPSTEAASSGGTSLAAGLGALKAASRFSKLRKSKPKTTADEPEAPAASGASLAGAFAAASVAKKLKKKAQKAPQPEKEKPKEMSKKEKKAAAAAAAEAAAAGPTHMPPVVLEDGRQVQRTDLTRQAPAPPSTETLKEINMLRRLVREEKAATEATERSRLIRVYEQRERNWQRQLEAAEEEARRSAQESQKAVAEAEAVRALLTETDKALDATKRRLVDAAATEAAALDKAADAVKQHEIAEAAVARLEPKLEELLEDLAKAAEREAQDASLQKTAVYWREQEKKDHAEKMAAMDKRLGESIKLQRKAENEARSLRAEKEQREEKEAEERARIAAQREREAAARRIQRAYKGKIRKMMLGGAMARGLLRKPKIKDEEEEEKVLVLRDACRWVGPDADRDIHAPSVLVSGLPKDFDEVGVLKLFEVFGPISSLRVLREEETRRSRGYAVVNYMTAAAAAKALEPVAPEGEEGGGLHGMELHGGILFLSWADRNNMADAAAAAEGRLKSPGSVRSKSPASRASSPKTPQSPKSPGKGKKKGKGKGKKPQSRGGSSSSAATSRATSRGTSLGGVQVSAAMTAAHYELMFADERAAWEAERAQWVKERKALLDYFDAEREALRAETDVAKLEMQHLIEFLNRVRATRYEDGVPPSEEEVDDYLTYLRIDGPVSRVQLRWLAEEAMHAPLPYGWTAHRHPDTLETYFYKRPTELGEEGISRYEHPIDAECRKLAQTLTEDLKHQGNAKKTVDAIRKELEAYDTAIEAVKAADESKRVLRRAEHEVEALEIAAGLLRKEAKQAQGKAAKTALKKRAVRRRPALGHLRHSDPQLPPPQEDAAAQAEESKRRAGEADIAFRNASEAAYEAKSEASRRTRERQQPEPWEDKPTTPPAEPQPELQPEPQPEPCVATA